MECPLSIAKMSIEKALHHLVTIVEEQPEDKDYMLATFHINGHLTAVIMKNHANGHRAFCLMSARCLGEFLQILSLFMWSLIVDKLL